jgi:hypothetical protein
MTRNSTKQHICNTNPGSEDRGLASIGATIADWWQARFRSPQTQIRLLTLTSCAPSQYGSTRVTIPTPGTENDDYNPPRIAPRHLFDIAVGDDNIFRGDKYKWSLRVTAINITNKVALYNFLSTFSGTHFLTPRTYTAELGFHF